jgi:hypothetical protein
VLKRKYLPYVFDKRYHIGWNDPLFKELKETAMEAAAQYNCFPSDLRIEGFDYPHEIIW